MSQSKNMSNINLTTENNIETKPSVVSGSLIAVAGILILVLGLYGIIGYFKQRTSAQLQETNREYEAEYEKFLAGNGNEVLDFSNRSDIAQQKLDESLSMSDILSQIEKSILPNVYLDSLKYDKAKGTVALDCAGDNFKTVAKQILSFKDNDFFSSVVPGQSSLDAQRNVIIFAIDLKIK